MKRKVITMMLALALVLSGCGSKKEDVTETQATVTIETETTEESTAASEETEAAGETETSQGETEAVSSAAEETETDAAEEKEKASSKTQAVRESKEQESAPSNVVKNTESGKKKEESKSESKAPEAGKPGNTQIGSQGSGNKKPSEPSKQPEKPEQPSKPAHTHSYDGGKVTKEATCSSEGVKTYTCGCGATKTESIGKTAHNYVTETTGATCTEAAKTKTVCSVCGDVQSETSSGSPLAHNYVKEYWPTEPSCTSSGHYWLTCTVCGADGGEGNDPALPHTPVTREEASATYCNENGVRVTECSVCGAELGRTGFSGTEHEWVTGTYEEWDPETHQVVTKESTVCCRCGVHQ